MRIWRLDHDMEAFWCAAEDDASPEGVIAFYVKIRELDGEDAEGIAATEIPASEAVEIVVWGDGRGDPDSDVLTDARAATRLPEILCGTVW